MKIPKRWTFEDQGVAQGFDSHVREQLPWYELATDVVANAVQHYLPRRGLVYDLGASTGNIGRAIAELLDDREASLIAVEQSADMAAMWNSPGELLEASIEEIEYRDFDVAVLFLVLMFCPVSERRKIISNLRAKLRPGGAIIVFDKAQPATGYVSTMLKRLTLACKLKQNASPEDILTKELSLAGVQRPIDVSILGDDAQQIFQFGEFVGFIIEANE